MLPDTALNTVAPAAVAAAVAAALGVDNVPVKTIFFPDRLAPPAFAFALALAFALGSGSSSAFLLAGVAFAGDFASAFAAAFTAALAAADIPDVPVVCASSEM